MKTHDMQTLNAQFAIPDQLPFSPIHGGLPAALIRNTHATATVALHGAHVTAFRPHDHKPVLWISDCNRYKPDSPIRGGIPVCWPWFGAHPQDAALPFHGFARISEWDVVRTAVLDGDVTLIELRLTDGPRTLALWPHAFDLRLCVRVGAQLDVELAMTNTGHVPVTCSSALHSYFAVREVTAIRVLGLERARFLDTVPNPPMPRIEDDPITVGAEVDRIYLDTAADCLIEDPGFDRRIRIAKRGSQSTVVWNPWVAKAARLADFGNEEYHEMLCVETTNASSDARVIAPGGQHRLAAVISVEPLRA